MASSTTIVRALDGSSPPLAARLEFVDMRLKNYPSWQELVLLAAVAGAAIVVHGYHPGVEDAEIYLPGIQKVLNPALYPYNQEFFASHARMTLFPQLIAGSVRLFHLPLDWGVLLWHWFSIFLLLVACWHLGRLCFSSVAARWGGVALVGSLLTIPVAGTALYIMDEYLTTRSLSTPAVLFIVVNTVERKFLRAILWAAFTACIHPLMVVFGASYALIFWLLEFRKQNSLQGYKSATGFALLGFPLGLFPPVSAEYRQALDSRPYFFLTRWHWYEWTGIFAPLLLFWIFGQAGRKLNNSTLQRICTSSICFGLLFFLGGLVITVPPSFANLAELQPMRSLHLLYILLFIVGGGLLGDFVLQNRIWRWVALFLPLCGAMSFVQTQTFPASNHLELPGTTPRNDWVKAFLWIRANTSIDAYFGLDPKHMSLPAEDQHGFRAIAERSRLADEVKDTGAVTMFPALAQTWHSQLQAEAGWEHFSASDFEKLRQRFGVNWVVLQQPGVPRLPCPYKNQTVLVCRIEQN